VITDVVILLVVLVAAVGGWRRGGARVVCRLAGLVGGGLVGRQLGRWIMVEWGRPGFGTGPVLAVAVVLGALVGAAVGGVVGSRLTHVLARLHLRPADRFAGAVIRGVAALAVCWIAAGVVAAVVPRTGVVAALGDSRVLAAVTGAVDGPDR